ncbi:MAG TPA: hypothetical protein ENI45_02235, partial [Thermoplasmatales archaeon]|nr:hypothetical protein [Thermoplasmatales archaeon]
RTYVGQVRKEDFEKYASTGYFYQLLQLNNLYAPTQGLKHFVAEYISPATEEKPFIYVGRGGGRLCLYCPAVVIAKYYEGAWLNCTVTCMGKPLRVAAAVQKTTVGTPVTVKHDVGFTDSNGSFSLLAPAGNISLLLYLTSGRNEHVVKEIVFNSTTNPDYYPITEDEATRRSNNYTRFLNITVNSSSLTGYVFDDVNGNKSYDKGIDTPLPDVRIQLYDLVNGGTTFVVTNETGGYNVSNLLPSIYELVATYEGFEIHTNETMFLAPDMNRYDIIKPKPSNIKGIVFYDSNNNATYDKGEEMEQARVQLIYSNTNSVVETKVTNATGTYSFSNILPGDYKLNVTVFNVSSGAPAYRALENITLEENTTLIQNISLTLAPIRVSGYTRYQSGETAGNVTIYFIAAAVENNTAKSATTESNATGYYTVALKPGVYNISAHVSVTDEETNETTSYSYRGTLSLSIGQPPVTAFDITLTREED